MATMKALVLNSDGGTPRLDSSEIARPVPDSNEVLVRVAACGVCYHDVAVVQGTLRRGVKPGVVPGHEVSGVIEEVGDAVNSIQVGDRIVCSLTTFCSDCERCAAGNEYRCIRGEGFGHAIDGGFTQFMAVPASSVIPIPATVDIVQAALIACPIGVAIRAIHEAARLQPGETALVAGAGGGLGVHLAQVAAAVGAGVFAVTTSPEKLDPLDSLPGVETILSDGELDFSEIVMALTGDEGAQVALNPVGSSLFASCLASLSQFGRMVVLGEIAGRAARFNLAELLFRDATVVGSTGASPRHIRGAIDLVASGAVKPIISHQFTFDEATDALELMRAGDTFGRVALIPPS